MNPLEIETKQQLFEELRYRLTEFKNDKKQLSFWCKIARKVLNEVFDLRTTLLALYEYLENFVRIYGAQYTNTRPEAEVETVYQADVAGFRGQISNAGNWLEQYVHLINLTNLKGQKPRHIRQDYQGFRVSRYIAEFQLEVGDKVIFQADLSNKGHFVRPKILEVIKRQSFYAKHESLRFIRKFNLAGAVA